MTYGVSRTQRRNVGCDMPNRSAAARELISPLFQRRYTSANAGGTSSRGRPNVCPRAPRGGNALGLPLADEGTLRFCHIAEKLQNDIRRQRSGEIALLPRIEQRHIQHHDADAPLVCENSPLLQKFRGSSALTGQWI